MFEGMDTGRKDDTGRPIKCGDLVEFYQWKDGYRDTYAQDGWGRSIPICIHDQKDVPPREKTIRGRVLYSQEVSGFVVFFDDYMLETGKKQERLYMLGKDINHKKDRLIVVTYK